MTKVKGIYILTRKPHSGQATCIYKTNSVAQIKQYWPFPSYDLHTVQSFHYSNEKNSPIVPFFKRNQEKPNQRLQSWFHHPPQVWFYEDKEFQHLLCSFAKNRLIRHYLEGFLYGFCTMVGQESLHLRRHISVI